MKWFGESWGAPICRIAEHVETPTGAICAQCHNPVLEADRGFVVPYLSYPVRHYKEVVYHHACFVKQFSGAGDYLKEEK